MFLRWGYTNIERNIVNTVFNIEICKYGLSYLNINKNIQINNLMYLSKFNLIFLFNITMNQIINGT